MTEIQLGELTWYCVCRKFPTPEEAKAAFKYVHEANPSGAWDIGIYRHMRVGLDDGAVLVSVVGHKKEGIEQALEFLGGEEIELHLTTWLEMIRRRAKMVLELDADGRESGSYLIPHSPEGDVI